MPEADGAPGLEEGGVADPAVVRGDQAEHAGAVVEGVEERAEGAPDIIIESMGELVAQLVANLRQNQERFEAQILHFGPLRCVVSGRY